MALPCDLGFLIKYLSSVNELARVRVRQKLNMVASNPTSSACAVTEGHLWCFYVWVVINTVMINKMVCVFASVGQIPKCEVSRSRGRCIANSRQSRAVSCTESSICLSWAASDRSSCAVS